MNMWLSKEKYVFWFLFIPVIFILSGLKPSQTISVEEIKVLKISPQDKRAIVKISGGDMEIMKEGDMIGDKIKVTAITQGRIMLEEITENGAEKVMVMVDDGGQKIMRIRKFDDKKPLLYAPQSATNEE